MEILKSHASPIFGEWGAVTIGLPGFSSWVRVAKIFGLPMGRGGCGVLALKMDTVDFFGSLVVGVFLSLGALVGYF